MFFVFPAKVEMKYDNELGEDVIIQELAGAAGTNKVPNIFLENPSC
jgi:hypothetical protein